MLKYILEEKCLENLGDVDSKRFSKKKAKLINFYENVPHYMNFKKIL